MAEIFYQYSLAASVLRYALLSNVYLSPDLNTVALPVDSHCSIKGLHLNVHLCCL